MGTGLPEGWSDFIWILTAADKGKLTMTVIELGNDICQMIDELLIKAQALGIVIPREEK